MRRTMALLLTTVLFLFAVGCRTTDGSSSDDAATTKTATTTATSSIDGETSTILNRSSEPTDTTTTTTEWKTTTQKRTEFITICPTMPPNPTTTVTDSDDEKTGTTVGGSSEHTVNVETDNKVTLPIKGHFSVIGDIIIETDKISVTNDVIPNAQAFTYKDGEFYKLKRYEAEVTIPQKYTTYGESYGKDISLPLQYFISDSTVYAYLNVDRKGWGGYVTIIPIPQNDECVIVQSLEVLPLYVNLKSGKITPVFDTEKIGFTMSGKVTCVSEDGEYAAALGTRLDEMISRSYIINLKNFEIAEISLPQYNEEYYKPKSSYPSVFADGRLYVNYTLSELDIDGGETVGSFFYDVKKKKSEALASPLTNYTSNEQYPYILTKFEHETGTLKIKNLKDITDYSFSVYPSNGLWGLSNKTGQYFVGTYFDMPLAGYDENGKPYYENNPQNQKYITMDAKRQKRIDLTKTDNKFNYTTYDGTPCTYRWISETELLVICYDGAEEYIQSVVNVAEDKK